jgi:multiple sugar transport system permease protein
MFARFSGNRGRDIREYLTAYLLISPALLLIMVFGIFPVLFAVYVSFHKWKIRQGDFLGLDNYIRAVDNLGYLMFFAAALGFLFIAYRNLKSLLETGPKAGPGGRWLAWAVPGLLHGGAWLLLLRFATLLLPEVLDIANKVRNLERTQEIFIQFLREAFLAEQVLPASREFLWVFFGALLVTAAFFSLLKIQRPNVILGNWSVFWFFLALGLLTSWYTYSQVVLATQLAVEAGEEVRIGIQIVYILGGLLLLYTAWKLWNRATESESNRGFVAQALAALFLIVGGWLLMVEIPAVIQSGDKDLWQGLQVTVFYSLGTIPFQLSISLVLAFMLFQRIKGKEFFRILLFLPYVTPAVASAAVFRLIFSTRSSAPVNAAISLLGGESQKWLQESRGVFELLAGGLGWDIQAAAEACTLTLLNMNLCWIWSWVSGPSLALVVIILYSIWTYVGYDTVIYLAGLGNIPFELNEAAAIDGANRWQIFRYITLPLLSPTTYFLSMIAVIGTFKAFNHIFVMRDSLYLGTVDTYSVVIFDEFFTKTRYGYASAMAFVLFAVILALTYVNNKVQGSRVFYE